MWITRVFTLLILSNFIGVHAGNIREGPYENHQYDGTSTKNTWHYVTIKRSGQNYEWSNRAGVSWTLYPTNDPNTLRVGEDSPYYADYGHRTAVFNELGVYGPFNEFYKFEGNKGCGGIDSGCCTSSTPCGVDDGDCDSDSDCKPGLVCGHNNCPNKGISHLDVNTWDRTDDCCAHPVTAPDTTTTLAPTPGEWFTAVWLSDDGKEIITNIGEKEFNARFAKCPVIQYTHNTIHSVYIRTSAIPSSFNAFSVFTNRWINTNNKLNIDFRLYDNLEYAKNDTDAWIYCNYNDTVGYPRDCGKTGYVPWRWFRWPHDKWGSSGVKSGTGFDIYSGSVCPSNYGLKLKFQLKGVTGQEKVTISIDGNEEEFVLTTEWQTFSYPRPSSGSFSVNFLNDNGPRDVYIRGHESQVADLLPDFASNKDWGCGTDNENERCSLLRNGLLAWYGKYTYTLKG